MVKKRLKMVSVIFVGSIALILVLYFSAGPFRIPKYSFTRNLLQNAIVSMSSIDIHFNSYYIACIDSGFVYLGNTTNPLHLLKVNASLRDTEQLFLHLDSSQKSRLKRPFL